MLSTGAHFFNYLFIDVLLTPSYPHDPHYPDDGRIYRYDFRFDFFQRDTHYGQYNDADVQQVPSARRKEKSINSPIRNNSA
jgi:hypothetical protein